jgi:hypothetical protein
MVNNYAIREGTDQPCSIRVPFFSLRSGLRVSPRSFRESESFVASFVGNFVDEARDKDYDKGSGVAGFSQIRQPMVFAIQLAPLPGLHYRTRTLGEMAEWFKAADC